MKEPTCTSSQSYFSIYLPCPAHPTALPNAEKASRIWNEFNHDLIPRHKWPLVAKMNRAVDEPLSDQGPPRVVRHCTGAVG